MWFFPLSAISCSCGRQQTSDLLSREEHAGLAASDCYFQNRFVSPSIAQKYNLDLPGYEGVDQVVELNAEGGKL